MQTIKIEKRITEELTSLLKLTEYLPAGKANALRNKCAKISQYAKKAQAIMDAPVGDLFPKPVHAKFDARDNEDIGNTYAQRKQMWQELLDGRVLSVVDDADRIGTRNFASRMSEIRSEIRDKNLPYHLCDQWVLPGGGRSKYKRYWLMDKDAAV